MGRERITGTAILACNLVGIVAYGLLLYHYPMNVLQLSLSIAVAGVLGIVAWIGWTMATTPACTETVGGSKHSHTRIRSRERMSYDGVPVTVSGGAGLIGSLSIGLFFNGPLFPKYNERNGEKDQWIRLTGRL